MSMELGLSVSLSSGRLLRALSEPLLEPYLGAVATRGRIPNGNSGGSPDSMCRSMHYATDDITSLRLVFCNWRLTAGREELPSGSGACTYKCYIEYPLGTFTPVTWSGGASGTAPTGGQVVSDEVFIVMRRGSLFAVRTFAHAAVARVFVTLTDTATQDSILNVALGEAYAAGASGAVEDLSAGGDIVTTTPNAWLGPAAIIATTRRRSVLIIGDSTDFGVGDSHDESGNWGKIARAIGPYAGYCNAGSPSANLTDHIATHGRQVPFAQYFSTVACGGGINDLTAGDSVDTVKANMQTVWGYYTAIGKHVLQTTISPRSSSTDLWATVSGQTAIANFIANRNAVNAWLLGHPDGVDSIFDVNPGIEEAPDLCKFKVNGAERGFVMDGTHPSRAGYLGIAAVFNPSLLAA